MVEVARRIPFTELKKLREQFGPGFAGRQAFRLIAQGVSCESPKVLGVDCNKPASTTVDFDVPRVNSLEQIPSCSNCQFPIRSKIQEDFKRVGARPSFSINGNGRS